MKIVKVKLILHLLFLISYSVKAQKIESKIIDYETKEPILGATIYFDGTTNGTITNEEGDFKIQQTTRDNNKLIVNCLGYQKKIIDLSGISKVDRIIYLKSKIEILDAVIITKDKWSRKKKLAYFKKEFLGISLTSNQCEIENEEDIKIQFNAQTQQLTAYSNKTIIIKNKHLGYVIHYDLSDFTIQLEKDLYFNSHYTKEVYYLGTSFFIAKKEKKKYRIAREKAYNGSKLHFMRSIKNNAIEENDFLIFYDRYRVHAKDYIKITTENGKTKVIIKEDKITILYKNHRQSFLVSNTDEKSFYINNFGNYFPSENISFGGDLGYKRMSTTLPLDYKQESENSSQ